jgi:hypothetical protein
LISEVIRDFEFMSFTLELDRWLARLSDSGLRRPAAQ